MRCTHRLLSAIGRSATVVVEKSPSPRVYQLDARNKLLSEITRGAQPSLIFRRSQFATSDTYLDPEILVLQVFAPDFASRSSLTRACHSKSHVFVPMILRRNPKKFRNQAIF